MEKILAKIIKTRIHENLDLMQETEQAEFRENVSFIDHIFTLEQLMGKVKEYWSWEDPTTHVNVPMRPYGGWGIE